MIWACGPSTLVDLDARTVRQAYAPQYLNLRREYMNSLLHQIHAQSTASIKYPWHQYDDIPSRVLVRSLIALETHSFFAGMDCYGHLMMYLHL